MTEILVAMAILAALVGIILSVLPMVQERRSSVVCTNNLRTIGISWRMWRADHNDQWPDNYNLRPSRILFDEGVITSYEVMQCPSALRLPLGEGGGWDDASSSKSTAFDLKFRGHLVSYGMNRSAWVSESQSRYATSYRFFLGRESAIPWLLDCKAWKTAGGDGPVSLVSYRHQGRANVLFLDAHVELLTQKEVEALALW